MKWSSKLPTEPGWYWIDGPEMVEVIQFDDDSLAVIWPHTAEAGLVEDVNTTSWAGPMPLPEDP